MILYHGSPNKEFIPQYGKGEEKHDYGKGFYLTEYKDLAKEWAVCNPDKGNGWLHKYQLDCKELKIFDFEKAGILSWLAELMKHRAADNSRRYKLLSEKFIAKYGISTEDYELSGDGEQMLHIFILQKHLSEMRLMFAFWKSFFILEIWEYSIA